VTTNPEFIPSAERAKVENIKFLACMNPDSGTGMPQTFIEDHCLIPSAAAIAREETRSASTDG